MLPIHDVLGALSNALAERNCAVLAAPPGAGKTTVVPLALLDAAWRGDGRILVLEPRRVAARAAAARMARSLGETVGDTVGLRVRMQSRISARTRIEVVTEGVFTRMILADPGLSGVAAVIFDEFHERSLDADLGLALAHDSQQLVRDDLRILVMSATLDGAAVARLLGEAPVIESVGRVHPVETRYLGRDERLPIEERVVRAVETALSTEPGSILAFLPGQAEIRRAADALAQRARWPDLEIAPLYGALSPADQDRAIAEPPPGRRKVVLATAIAETSLTIQGVRVVVDCGQARVPRYDPASGLTRLATVRVSRAAADQRRGRAGRTEPGVCYRLWEAAETRALPAYADPEILDADLSRLALDLARWGARDPGALVFLDPPPAAAFTEARALLRRLEAIDEAGVLTPHGEVLSQFPLAPRLAHMVLRAAASGQARRAAEIAALVTEQGLGGRDPDLRRRLEVFGRERSVRSRDARRLVERWTELVGRQECGELLEDGLLLALAYPERIARARGPLGEFQLASGRGAYLEPTDALAREPWLAVAELGGGARRDRILLAAPVSEAGLTAAFASQLETETRLEEGPGGRLRARTFTRLGALTLRARVADGPDQGQVAAALADQVRSQGVGALPLGPRTQSLRDRVLFVRGREGGAWPDFTDAGLVEAIDAWLAPHLSSVRALADLKPDVLEAALRGMIPYELHQKLETSAPVHWTAPTGHRHSVDYATDGAPRVAVRVQELFGLATHPTVGGVPLTLALLSPAHRPVQTTRDLPGFWRGSWKAVRAEMRGRYPRHPWPEDPASAQPTTRAKPRGRS